MQKFEAYILEKGKLVPTGIWVGGHSIDYCSKELHSKAKHLQKPYAIFISNI